MHESDPEFAVLHVLALRGLASAEAVAAAAGADVAGEHLPRLVAAELVKERSGRMAGFALTRDGRAKHADLLAADREAGGLVAALRAPYEQFLAVNQPFIDLCSAWQLRRDTGEPNDHADEAYDAGIVGELEEIHTTGAAVGSAVAEIGTRFASYGPRLEAAMGKVRAGERDWFTKPTIDSYHTVWFELHEDLLRSQDIERAEGR